MCRNLTTPTSAFSVTCRAEILTKLSDSSVPANSYPQHPAGSRLLARIHSGSSFLPGPGPRAAVTTPKTSSAPRKAGRRVAEQVSLLVIVLVIMVM
jgi:hypothetical protein